MAAKKPAPAPPPEGPGLAFRIAGLESRVKAEARIAQARIEKLEARVERIAAALTRRGAPRSL